LLHKAMRRLDNS